jgi:DNA-binding protein H-NS
LGPEKNSTISELNRLATLVGTDRCGCERLRIAIFLSAKQLMLFIYRSPSAHNVGVGESNHDWGIMKRSKFEVLSTEELWFLHNKVTAKLKAKIIAEKNVLEDRLARLNGRLRVEKISTTPERRFYPTVFPKFQNPEQPSETWAGRGKKPRWLTAQLKLGRQIDDFRIELTEA